MNIKHFNNAQQSIDFLVTDIAHKLTHAIEANGQAGLLVSGGRSPIGLFNALSMVDINWSKVFISLVDDRWVADVHDSSNARLVKTHLLINKASAANFIGLVGQQDSAFEGVSNAIENIKKINQIDIMILGMGEDGHTASIFPCCEQVHEAMSPDNHNRLIATRPQSADFERISVTLNEILQAKHVYLPLSGLIKLRVLELAQSVTDTHLMPISAVLKRHHAIDIVINQ